MRAMITIRAVVLCMKVFDWAGLGTAQELTPRAYRAAPRGIMSAVFGFL